jgi:hypothetical protein
MYVLLVVYRLVLMLFIIDIVHESASPQMELVYRNQMFKCRRSRLEPSHYYGLLYQRQCPVKRWHCGLRNHLQRNRRAGQRLIHQNRRDAHNMA